MNFFWKLLIIMMIIFAGYIYSPSISSVMSEHKMGEWIEVEGIEYKVTHVKMENLENNKSVRMKIEIKNKTKEQKEIDYLMFALLDENGNTYTPNITDQLEKGTEGEIVGELPSNAYKKGTLFFNVPKEAKKIKLNILSAKNTIFIEKKQE